MSSPNMRRACPTQSYGLTTMPGSRRTSCIDPSDHPELLDDRYRQLEAIRQQEIQRGVGLCAHLNRHGCGLGVSRSQYGLCSACSFFCTHSEHDPRTANTDTTNMTYEEIAQLELALARRVMFCEAESPPRGPGLAEAVAVTAAIAEQAERQAAAHARLEEEYRNKQMANRAHETETSEREMSENTEQANRDEEMQDAPEAGPSRGPAPQRGPSQRGHVNKTARQRTSSTANAQQTQPQAQQRQQRERVPRSEAEMMLDPEIKAYLTAVSRMPPQPHPLPPAIIAAQARAQHEAMLQRNMAAEQARQHEKMEQQRQKQQQERNRLRAQQRDQKQYEAQLAKNRQRQLQKQQEEEAREEASQADLTEEERAERRKKRREEREEQARQQLLRLQAAGREHVLHQQEKLQQERVKRQQRILQRQQQENQERREEKGKEREQPQQQQNQVLPVRQPLPVATRGD